MPSVVSSVHVLLSQLLSRRCTQCSPDCTTALMELTRNKNKENQRCDSYGKRVGDLLTSVAGLEQILEAMRQHMVFNRNVVYNFEGTG
mmetsp:Transcript_8619/g.14591  ORF Transcript_8619/g.14591 Transcript_8619/m.14591 type:complete len:88 (-) Transcript_8619:2432-2695(-)